MSLPATPSVEKGGHGMMTTPVVGDGQICSTPELHRELPTTDARELGTPGYTQLVDAFISATLCSVYV